MGFLDEVIEFDMLGGFDDASEEEDSNGEFMDVKEKAELLGLNLNDYDTEEDLLDAIEEEK